MSPVRWGRAGSTTIGLREYSDDGGLGVVDVILRIGVVGNKNEHDNGVRSIGQRRKSTHLGI